MNVADPRGERREAAETRMSVAKVVYEGGVAVLAVSNPPVNVIDAEVRAGISRALDEIRNAPAVKAVVLLCEGSTFFSGADIGEFSGPPREEEYRRLFGRIEGLPVPVIAAMHGTVLGGGLEIALACHYRIAAPESRFGFPEINLGIIPGAGGTQRLPRLIGVERALELILDARPVTARAAADIGVVDRIAKDDLRGEAVAWAEALVAEGRGPRRTADRAVDPGTADPAVLERFRNWAAGEYKGRQAPLTAIEAVRASAILPFARGLEYETELVNEAKATTESKAAIHVFFAERETRKVPDVGPDVEPRRVSRVAVVGAGTMGGGIAIAFANAGIPVTVLDATREALARGLGVVEGILADRVRRGRLSPEEKAKRFGLITGSLDYDSVKEADLVVEAVFEDLELKKEIFRRLDAAARPGAILATNTSTLDIEEIAAVVARPEDVVGLHFFSPAHVMPLLEVVRTRYTARDVVQTAMALARPLRKTPVLSGVCYGFIGNRMMEGYAREAERMVLEGATPRRVDTALEDWGMAMGILAVFDMAGIGVGVAVHRANAHRYPPDPTYYQADATLLDAGREGQKNGRGYYRYEGRQRIDDPEAVELLHARGRALGVPRRSHDDEEIVERCLFPLINEGLRILEEGIALRPGDVDVVWCAGYGFPRWRGGPMFLADTIGLERVYEGMLEYGSRLGEPFRRVHWAPAPLLEQLVREGRSLSGWAAKRGD
jgi:3-hydroxyacyl-CoA dehydrogenase